MVMTAGKIIRSTIPLSTLPTITIGGVTALVSYAKLVASGKFQINVTVPNVGGVDQLITIAMGSSVSQGGAVLAISR